MSDTDSHLSVASSGAKGHRGKPRRIPKACTRCRQRKQRCSGPPAGEAKQPCTRCVHLGTACSFMWDAPNEKEDNQRTREKLAGELSTLRRLLNHHEARLRDLEDVSMTIRPGEPGPLGEAPVHQEAPLHSRSEYGDESHNTSSPQVTSTMVVQEERNYTDAPATWNNGLQTASNHVDLFLAESPDVNSANAIAALDLDTPISTLQRLRSLKQGGSLDQLIEDPISSGTLTMEEAQHAFDFFFAKCHQWAPVLCAKTQRSAPALWVTNSALFVSICAVAFRFTNVLSPDRYKHLVSILDLSIGRLLLRPNSDDVNLNTIQSLLLYIQWMPMDLDTRDNVYHTRYNDVSAWSVLGLAIRYALMMGLQVEAVEPFVDSKISQASTEDVGRLRVWINILTCDANLMLSSGRPASLNPEPMAAVARSYASHRLASHPEDTRVAALCELVAILKRAARSSGKFNIRSLDSVSLRQINVDFDAWEREWNRAIGPDIQHNQMPFTTLRTYRLCVNSACLSPLLSTSSGTDQVSIHTLHALEVSLTAATQTIVAFSSQATWRNWQSDFTESCRVPDCILTPNERGIDRFIFAVDSSSISFTFAIVFLVICYRRGAIDDDLTILALRRNASNVTYPMRPRPSSKLHKLLSLAADIFRIICSGDKLAHPLMEYRKMLDNVVFALIHGDGEQGMVPTPADTSFGEDLTDLFDTLANNPDLSRFV